MKAEWEDDFEMAEEYDFSKAVKNPYVQRFQELNLVSLDEELRAAFPDSQAVNEALLLLLRVARDAAKSELPKAS